MTWIGRRTTPLSSTRVCAGLAIVTCRIDPSRAKCSCNKVRVYLSRQRQASEYSRCGLRLWRLDGYFSFSVSSYAVALSTILPDELILGLEIRMKVTEYVDLRIKNLREENPGKYQNASVMRTNAMKYLSNYIRKGQLSKMFFCFPDPHFKEKNHRRRIIRRGVLYDYHLVAKCCCPSTCTTCAPVAFSIPSPMWRIWPTGTTTSCRSIPDSSC